MSNQFDAHKNFAYSNVATAPSPDDSGTSLVVTAADGVKFPAVPFNAVIWPVGVQPISSNAEIVRVTNIGTGLTADTLTIARAQESSTARHVIVGDQIAANITLKMITDIEKVAKGVPYLTNEGFIVPENYQATFGVDIEMGDGDLEIDGYLVDAS